MDYKNIARLWQEVVEGKKKKLDAVDPEALKGKHADRKDKDIDNDGDADKSDEYLHNRRQAIKKNMAEENDEKEVELEERNKENAMKRKNMDASRGAKFKLNNPVPDRGPEHKTGTAHNKAIGRALRNENDDEDDDDDKMDKNGMKKCEECGGSTINHNEECSKYSTEKKEGNNMKKESVRHAKWGHGEIISESAEGIDVLFEHGVEFNVPSDQLEGVMRAVKVAKKMGGNMTGATKKIEKMKKGMSDNPRVAKALQKANEEEEVDEGYLGQKGQTGRDYHNAGLFDKDAAHGHAKRVNGVVHADPSGKYLVKHGRGKHVQESVVETVVEKEKEVVDSYNKVISNTRAALMQMWEASQEVVKSSKTNVDGTMKHVKKAPHGSEEDNQDSQKKQLKRSKGEEDFINKHTLDVIDGEVAEVDSIVKAQADAVKSQAPNRGNDNRKGDTKIINKPAGVK
jgi:hypothetical protein